MKRFSKNFLISYIVTSVIIIILDGSINLFGESGFHMDINTLIVILIWSLIPALFFAGLTEIIYFIINLGKKSK